jgi:enolase-phosphatase E1
MSQPRTNQASPQVYLLDVEGTVAPISLVSEQLFPYARAHFSAFLEQHHSNPEIAADLTLLATENSTEPKSGCPTFGAASSRLRWEDAVPYLFWLMDHDHKSTALKSLQGKIWKSGFESGELKGTLFADVPDAMRRWSASAHVAIYSSGSIEAQRLVFRHSMFGDLTSLITAYFDTRTGPKQACASYAAIAAELRVEPEQVLFFSDVVRELDAAREAGCQTCLVVRAGNVPVEDPHSHAVVESFALL